jgi:hypothetical protein
MPSELVDLGENVVDEAKALFVSLAERKQTLSPIDRDALVCILGEYKIQIPSWLPQTIPVRENVAIIFGTLFKACDSSDVVAHARPFMTSATDVLRFIAVLSGTDGSLLRETVFKTVEQLEPRGRFWGCIAELLGANPPVPGRMTATIPLRVSRFKTAKLSRRLRRALLAVLEGLDPDRLIEDMLRHQSYWVWVGEFLHLTSTRQGFRTSHARSRSCARSPRTEHRLPLFGAGMRGANRRSGNGTPTRCFHFSRNGTGNYAALITRFACRATMRRGAGWLRPSLAS